MEKNKSRMGVGILIGVLAALVVVLAGYIVYDKMIHKDNNIQSNNQDNSQNIDQSNNQDTEKILYRIEENKDNSTSKFSKKE